jgi:membrane protein implicated in regulation of membrane protease activity
MADEDNAWVVFLTAGTSLFVVAFLLSDQTAWYVQYGAFALAMLVLVYAMVRGASRSEPA